MTETNAESNDLIHHRLRNGKITVAKVNYTCIPENALCDDKITNTLGVVRQKNVEHERKSKIVSNPTLSKLPADEQNVKQALRRSPRCLTTKQPSSQEEVETIEHIAALSVNSSITESPKNASSDRELLKIKDCWSPKASPDGKVRLLRNGRTLQLPSSPLKKESPLALKEDNASFGDTELNKTADEITKKGSENDSNNDATDLKRSYVYHDTVIDEAYEYFPRRKKLRSEVTNDELWEGLPQNIRFKRLTPKKEKTTSNPSLLDVDIHDGGADDTITIESIESTNTEKVDNTTAQRNGKMTLKNQVLRRSPRKKSNYENIILQPISPRKVKSVFSPTEECSTPSSSLTDKSVVCDRYLNTVVLNDKPQEHRSQRLRTRRSLNKELEGTTDDLSEPKDKIQDKNCTNVNIRKTAVDEDIDVNTCSESAKQLTTEDNQNITPEFKKIETRILRRSPRKTKRNSYVQGSELSAESGKMYPHSHNHWNQLPQTESKKPYETFDSAVIKTEIIENTDNVNSNDKGYENSEQKIENTSKMSTESDEKITDKKFTNDEKEEDLSLSDDLFYASPYVVASPRKTTTLKDDCGNVTDEDADNTLLGIFDDSVPQPRLNNVVNDDSFSVLPPSENMEETICYEMDELKQDRLYEKENVSMKDKSKLNEEFFEESRTTDDNNLKNPHTADDNIVEYPQTADNANGSSGEGGMDNENIKVHQDGFEGILSTVKIKVEPTDDYFGINFEVDNSLKSDTLSRRSNCRNDNTTPLKRSARLMDKRVNTPSRKHDIYLYSPIPGKNDNPECNQTVESKYTIIKNKIQSLSGYSSEDSFGNTPRASSVKAYPANRKTVETNKKKVLKLSPFSRSNSNLPYNQNATETDGCSHDNNEKSEDSDKKKTETSNRPTIKLRMQKTPDGQTRIIPNQPTQLQLSPFVSLPRIDCQQDDKCEATTSKKKKNLLKNNSKANTITNDQRKRDKTTQEKDRAPNCSRRRPRSPSEDSRMTYGRSCRRKTENTEDILNNATIGKHASILWLSENRRHFLQKYSDSSSSAEVDKIMAAAWENLADKEKLRFYQRAKNAMKDENKHSAPKVDTETVPAQGVSRKMTKFLSLSPTEQHNELKRWLAFVHEISPGEYAKLIADFKDAMKEEKCRRQASRSTVSSVDIQSHHRRSLFQKILDVREKIVDIYHQKREKQMELVKEGFDIISKRLIAGDQLNFSRTVRSEELEQVLTDLRCLENELKIAVSGTPLKSKSYDNVLEQLHDCEQEFVMNSVLRSQDPEILVDLPTADSVYAHELLKESINSNLWGVDSGTVNVQKCHNTEEDLTISEEILHYLSSFFEHEAHANFTMPNSSERTCPSQILTNWVLADQFKSLSKAPSLFGSGVQMLVDPKHLVPFLRGQNLYNATSSQPHVTLPKGYFSATGIRPTSATKNNNAVKRVPGVSKYDKYKRTTADTPVIIHYSRPSKPYHGASAECQRQPHLQFDHKLLHPTNHPTQSVYNEPILVLKQDPSHDRAIPPMVTQEQRKPLTRLYSIQDSIVEKEGSSPAESSEDVTESQKQNPLISLQYIRRQFQLQEANSHAQRPRMSTLMQYPDSCVVQQEPSLPKSAISHVNANIRASLFAEQEGSLMYPYTHSVIHRKIHNEDGRTVVKFTATAFDGRRIS